MDLNDSFWNDIFSKKDILWKISDLKKKNDEISYNVETIVFQEIFEILKDKEDYIENMDNKSIQLNENEIKYLNERINNLKSVILKSMYTFIKYLSTHDTKDLYSSIDYINNKLSYILDSFHFDHEITKNRFISNIFIPYVIFLHEYIIHINFKTAKFNKIFKDLIYNHQIGFDNRVKITDSVFKRNKIDKSFINDLIFKLKENPKEDRIYLKNLELCEYIYNKRGNKSEAKKIDKEISDLLMKLSVDKPGFVKNIFIKEAVKYDNSKEIDFQENRNNYNLYQYTDEFEIPEYLFMDKCIESFDFYKLIDIITNLTLLFKTETGDPLIDDCRKYYIDENNNITETSNFNSIKTQIDIKCYHAELIGYLLNFGHLYHKEIWSYLNKSWFDKDILDNIEFPLKIFFKKDKRDLEIRCAISILIPQFEKIIRKLAINNKIIKENEDFEGLKMSTLMNKKEFIELIGEDIHNYINYVFFNKGLNLRNKFLHSTTNNIFTENNLYILFICLIKLSNNFNY